MHTWLWHDTQETLDTEQKSLDDIKTWVKTLTDARIRRAYLYWLDYYQRELNASYKEFRTHKIADEQEIYRRQDERRHLDVDGILNDFPKPPRG